MGYIQSTPSLPSTTHWRARCGLHTVHPVSSNHHSLESPVWVTYSPPRLFRPPLIGRPVWVTYNPPRLFQPPLIGEAGVGYIQSTPSLPTTTHWRGQCGLHTVHPVSSNHHSLEGRCGLHTIHPVSSKHHSLESPVWVTYSPPRLFQPPLFGEAGVGYIQSTPSLPTTTHWKAGVGYIQSTPSLPTTTHWKAGVGYIQSTPSLPTTTHWRGRCGLHTVHPVSSNHHSLEGRCGLHTVHPVSSNHHSLESPVWVTYSPPRLFQPPLIGEAGVGYIQSTPSLPTTTHWKAGVGYIQSTPSLPTTAHWRGRCGLHTVHPVSSNHHSLEGRCGLHTIHPVSSNHHSLEGRCGLYTIHPVSSNHRSLERPVWVTYSPPCLFQPPLIGEAGVGYIQSTPSLLTTTHWKAGVGYIQSTPSLPTTTHWRARCGLHTVHPVSSNHHSLESPVWVTYSPPRLFQPPLIEEPGVGYIQSTPSLPTTTHWRARCGLHTVHPVSSNHHSMERPVWVTYSPPRLF